ncbi:gamma-glutamyl-gamma-aminobutyrate hydrolase family protein [Candidatus Peregrinibacteria bacterium]|nr:gamma-glutamyl-gamma-aminobutyrate hydrolase family protein [Candidatus Peregrinibacteria bacterium]
MNCPHSPRYKERLSTRARALALLLPVLSGCDSKEKATEKAQAAVSASASSAVTPAPLEPIMEPVICVNGPLGAGKRDELSVRVRQGLEQAGAKPFRVNPENFQQIRENCNGFFVVGGADIDTTKIPQSEPLHAKAKIMSGARQQFDEMFIRWAREKKAPIFGECLGLQEIVVFEGAGGRLIQHLPDVSKTNHRGYHTVHLNKRAVTAFGLGSDVRVNSQHHQAPKDPLPPTLEVVGRGPDQLIEAVISKDGLVWGVQWHPKRGPEQKIFEEYVEMVTKRGYRSPQASKTGPLATKKSGQKVNPNQHAETVKVGDVASAGKCPAEMVNIAGQFCIDRYESSLVDTEQHRVLSPYYSPVKSRLVRDFNIWSKKAGTSVKPENSRWEGPILDETMSIPAPYAWQMNENYDFMALSRQGVLPSGYMSQDDARLACENTGKRLCTNDEWEKACGGEQGWQFPYGESYVQGKCNVFRYTHPADAVHGIASRNLEDPRLNQVSDKDGPLLHKTGTTPTCISRWGTDGVHDMVGNLAEWIGDVTAFKGGFYSRSTRDGCYATLGQGHAKGYYNYSQGTRCCKD